MSSIFLSSVSKLIERVYRKGSEAPGATRGADETFARLLGDLENPQKHLEILGDPDAECELPTLQNDVLTNLTLGEKSIPSAPMIVAPIATPYPGSIDLPVAKLTPVSVPPSDTAVKGLTPQLQVRASAPASPEILTARKVLINSYLKSEPTQSPKLSKLDEIREIIHQAGAKHGIDPNLSFAVAKAESALQVYAVSKDGHKSKGLFQLLDSTARDMMDRIGSTEQYKPFDPTQNSQIGVAYLRRLHNLFNKESNLGYNIHTVPARSAADLEKLAVAAFNAGEGRVAKAQAKAKSLGKDPSDYAAVEPHLPPSTRSYVRHVLDIRVALNSKTKVDETV